jgi:glycopeptide antibiotics resistance protein
VGAEVVTQDVVVQWPARRLGSRVGVRVDESGQHPAFGDEFRAGHPARGPPVAVGVEIDRLAVGQAEPANAQHRHHATSAASLPPHRPAGFPAPAYSARFGCDGGGMLGGWHDWFGTITGVVLVTVLLFPVAAAAVWVLARRRGGHAWRRSLAEVGIVYGTAPWVWMIMLPGDGGRVSLVPLRDLFTVLAAGPSTIVVQIVGNLLVFAALGFFGPLRFAALASVPRVLAVAAAGSALVETGQYVLQLDRVTSVDDVLLNTAGAGLAALASRRWWGQSPAAVS